MDLADAIKLVTNGDRALAFREVQLAAAEGNASAMGILGVLYYAGEGVPEDGELARILLAEAAALGDATAAHNLGTLYATGAPPVERNPKKARLFHGLGRSRDPHLGFPEDEG